MIIAVQGRLSQGGRQMILAVQGRLSQNESRSALPMPDTLSDMGGVFYVERRGFFLLLYKRKNARETGHFSGFYVCSLMNDYIVIQ